MERLRTAAQALQKIKECVCVLRPLHLSVQDQTVLTKPIKRTNQFKEAGALGTVFSGVRGAQAVRELQHEKGKKSERSFCTAIQNFLKASSIQESVTLGERFIQNYGLQRNHSKKKLKNVSCIFRPPGQSIKEQTLLTESSQLTKQCQAAAGTLRRIQWRPWR